MNLRKRLQLGIRGRLYLLVALFGLGCAALASTLIWLQSQQAFEARKQHLQQLVAAANGVLAAHKALADAGEMPAEAAKKRALKVIGAMWYDKDGYFTARSVEGISLLNAADPSKEGKNRDQATDSRGHYYSRELTELVQGPGEGYVTFYTTNPDTKLDEEKVTYIKLYKPWGIATATGVFVGDIAAETHAAMIRAGLITLLLVGAIGTVVLWVARGIAQPLMRLRAAMLDLATGRAISGTLETERRDEIGAMASAVKVFEDNALALKAADAL